MPPIRIAQNPPCNSNDKHCDYENRFPCNKVAKLSPSFRGKMKYGKYQQGRNDHHNEKGIIAKCRMKIAMK
jgi:hypothetical protein